MNIKTKNKLIFKNKQNYSQSNSLLGLVGIKNLGNTCYMNAGVQCLSNFYEFSNYFLKKEFDKRLIKETKENKDKKEINTYDILIKFTQIIKRLHFGKDKLISIQSFRKFNRKN